MINELNLLINIRNFLNSSINDFSFQMSNEKQSAISKKIAILNKEILNAALLLDVEKIIFKDNGYGDKINSTKEIKTVEELDKLILMGKQKVEVKSKTKEKVKNKQDEATK